MRSRLLLLVFGLTGLLFTVGCEPECYVVDPIAKVRADLRKQVDDRLDLVDATDAQKAKIQKLFEATLPTLEKVRAETTSRQREIVTELRRNVPDRTRLGALIDKNLDAGQRYVHAIVEVMLKSHALLTPEQRKKLAHESAKPSEAFEGSWLLDRGVDYFLSRIDATSEQRTLVERIKQHLLQTGRTLQRKSDVLRLEVALEFAKDKPDAARMHACVDRGRGVAKEALFNLSGYYLLLTSKLDARQRQLLNAEMVRFEPCPAAPPAHGIAALPNGA